jgi:Holliday junction DNA helicase RuvA
MIEYIKGEIAELSPAHATLEVAGIGYFINISLSTYSQLQGKTATKLFIHEAIREDAFVLYGFLTQSDRELFLHLLSVSGVGANTARMIMSSLNAAELQEIIMTGNVSALKAVKGIGQKTAERIIVDLKDKIGKVEVENASLFAKDNSIKTEAVAALVMLGFNQQASAKAIEKILQENPAISIEQLIKLALKTI